MANRPLHVHALVDTMAAGGAELLLSELAAVAHEADIRLTVGYLRDEAGSPAAVRLRSVGLEPTRVGVRRLSWPALKAVRGHLQRTRPDILHTHLGASDLLGGLSARTLRLPSVSTIHTMQWGGSAPDHVRELLFSQARRRCAKRVIAVSEVARRAYLDEGRDVPAHVVVLPNGVRGKPATGAGAGVRAEFDIAPDEHVVGFIAALRPEKAHDVAAAAIGLLRAEGRRVRLIVVGQGGHRPAVERAMQPLGEAGIMTGHRSDVMELLDACDLVVQPSYVDALPTALIEAAAASVPAVATRVGGIPEIVEDGVTGVLVDPPPDAQRVAGALADLLDDADRRGARGAAARQHFLDRFSGPAWAGRLRALYDEVLAER